ncbi:MAG: pseudouridine synthase [Oscillospiraceae bacterium]
MELGHAHSNIQAYLRQNGQWDPKAENAFTPALCNRIDRNTGGIVIAAKNAEALRILNDKIRGRGRKSPTSAFVCGRPRPAEDGWRYLFKDAVKPGLRDEKAAARRQDRRDGTPQGAGLSLVMPAADRLHAPDPARRWPPPAAPARRRSGPRAHQPQLRRTGQMLYSYKLTFTLPTDAGILEYLRGRTVREVAFGEIFRVHAADVESEPKTET